VQHDPSKNRNVSENETTSVAALDSDQPEINSYAAVRHNALRHGVLSQLVVLPHEDKEVFSGLLSSLILEHQPNGPTEGHLVEELAGIMWRKRRILLAEGAEINKGLRSTLHYVHSRSSDTVKNAVPADLDLVDSCVGPHDLMSMTPDQLRNSEQEAIGEQEVIERADQILCQSGSNAYEDALSTLSPDHHFWWQNLLDAGRMETTDSDLSEFINENLLPNNQGRLAQIRHCEAIKRQVIGEGFDAYVMENLTRYETHLDRKFQRTLAMLIKLKELRSCGK
jgi:hypothetical protein